MSQIKEYCNNYTNFERIGIGSYANIYKAQNKKTKSYVAIKEIDKKRYNELTKVIFNEVEIMSIIKNENSVQFKSKIDSKDYFYYIDKKILYDLLFQLYIISIFKVLFQIY